MGYTCTASEDAALRPVITPLYCRVSPPASPTQMAEEGTAKLRNLSNPSLSADFGRAHPPHQPGFGAKVSTGSYLTQMPALLRCPRHLFSSREQQRRVAETAACQDGAGLNYPRSHRDMGQLPQFVRQGEERKVKKSLLWERKPVVSLLGLIRI